MEPSDPAPLDHAARPFLVAGAGGFLGASIVRALVDSGRSVRGLVRSESRGPRVAAAGGTPVVADVLDLGSLRDAAAGCEAIIHVAANPSETAGSTDLARRVRVEGTSNLVSVARAHRVRRLVVGSGYWVYAGSRSPITEESAVDPRGESRVNYDAERVGLAANSPGELEVLVVRPGMVYGDGSWFRSVFDAIHAGLYRTIDGGRNAWSFISLPDTGRGFRDVLEYGIAGETYNLTDGHPGAWGEFATYVAGRVGRPAPTSVSLSIAEQDYGVDVAHHLSASRSIVPHKLQALGWRPIHPSYREGIDVLLAHMRPSP